MVKIPREEVAYSEFMEEMLRYMVAADPALTDADIEELKAEAEQPEMKAPIMQALNSLLWKEDARVDLAIKNLYKNIRGLILATIPEVDRGPETKSVLKLLDSLIAVEDTEEEILTPEELNELAGED